MRLMRRISTESALVVVALVVKLVSVVPLVLLKEPSEYVVVPVSVGLADNTVLPVPVEVVTPVPPLATARVPVTPGVMFAEPSNDDALVLERLV